MWLYIFQHVYLVIATLSPINVFMPHNVTLSCNHDFILHNCDLYFPTVTLYHRLCMTLSQNVWGYMAPAVGDGPSVKAKAMEAIPPWAPELPVLPWLPGLPAPPWHSELSDPPWSPSLSPSCTSLQDAPSGRGSNVRIMDLLWFCSSCALHVLVSPSCFIVPIFGSSCSCSQCVSFVYGVSCYPLV